MAFQAGRPVQGELKFWGAKDRAVFSHLQVVSLSAVVESWRAVHHKPHLTAYAPHGPNQTMPVGCALRVLDRHEVDHLPDTAGVMNRVIRMAVSGK